MTMDVGLLILQVVIGLLMMGHGAQKLFGWFGGQGLRATTDWLAGMGLRAPRFWALMAGLAELGGG
ncbi:MAG: DoxX family protein, partial [Chloroflexus sp.]|nr:DoxX family protein [Chloroflexus sp.]